MRSHTIYTRNLYYTNTARTPKQHHIYTKQTLQIHRPHTSYASLMARAKGMAQIAEETGLSREQLYRSFSERGNPTLKTTLAIMKALGVQLTAKHAA